MNDEPPNDPTNEPLQEQGTEDAHIRALLAELGSGPDGRPMPREVAARLDDTLARLVAERASSPESSPESSADSGEDASAAGNVVPLRRRWVPRATAAAAAVVVLGAGSVAVANFGILGNGNGTSVSSDSAGRASDEKAAPEDAGGDTGSAPGESPTSPTSGDTALIPERTTGAALPEISARSFEADVTTLLQPRPSTDTTAGSPTAGSDPGGGGAEKSTGRLATPEDTGRGGLSGFSSKGCSAPEITDGGVPNLVRYDGRVSVLVVHPEQDGGRLVEAWACAGDRKLASTTITP